MASEINPVIDQNIISRADKKTIASTLTIALVVLLL
jgi:hypothetical protein